VQQGLVYTRQRVGLSSFLISGSLSCPYRATVGDTYFSGACVIDLSLIFTAILEDINELLVPGAPLAVYGQ